MGAVLLGGGLGRLRRRRILLAPHVIGRLVEGKLHGREGEIEQKFAVGREMRKRLVGEARRVGHGVVSTSDIWTDDVSADGEEQLCLVETETWLEIGDLCS